MTTFDRPARALQWAVDTFGPIAMDAEERATRFLEEAVELAHAMGIRLVTTQAVVARVYSRDKGDVAREVGQAQMTLETFAKAVGIDAEGEADKEFFRIQAIPKEEWERRHAAKKAIGIAS